MESEGELLGFVGGNWEPSCPLGGQGYPLGIFNPVKMGLLPPMSSMLYHVFGWPTTFHRNPPILNIVCLSFEDGSKKTSGFHLSLKTKHPLMIDTITNTPGTNWPPHRQGVFVGNTVSKISNVQPHLRHSTTIKSPLLCFDQTKTLNYLEPCLNKTANSY